MHKLIINISLAALLALSAWLTVLIVSAISVESMFTAFAPIWQAPWGKVAMVDLYLGLFVVALLIIVFEQARWPAFIWAIAVLLLGNPVAVAYLLVRRKRILALLSSKTDQ